MNFSEWLDTLNDILVPHISRGLYKLYDDVRSITDRVPGGGQKTLMAFQFSL